MKIKYKIKDKIGYEYNGITYYKEIDYWHKERKEVVTIEELPGDKEYDYTRFINGDQGCIIKSKGNTLWTFLNYLKPLLHEN